MQILHSEAHGLISTSTEYPDGKLNAISPFDQRMFTGTVKGHMMRSVYYSVTLGVSSGFCFEDDFTKQDHERSRSGFNVFAREQDLPFLFR